MLAHRDGMMEQLERFLLVASGDELTGKPSMHHHSRKDPHYCYYAQCGVLVVRDRLR